MVVTLVCYYSTMIESLFLIFSNFLVCWGRRYFGSRYCRIISTARRTRILEKIEHVEFVEGTGWGRSISLQYCILFISGGTNSTPKLSTGF